MILLHAVYLEVSFETCGLLEALAAHITLVRVLTSVNPHVAHQNRRLVKLPITYGTWKRLLTCVYQLMPLHEVLLGEPLMTHVTFIRLFTSVRSLMHFESKWPTEAFVTDIALIGAISIVGFLVCS